MERNRLFYKLIKGMLILPVKIIFPYEEKGKENIENIKNSYILCSNHLSNLDPVFLLISNPRPICFMAKAELFKNKIFGWILKKLGAFAVERGRGDKKALINAENTLRHGDILGIFIEGTRSRTGDFLKPKSGAALLACKTGTQVVPVCITGGGKDNKVKAFKKTVISYAEPVCPPRISAGDDIGVGMLRKTSNNIMDKIKGMR